MCRKHVSGRAVLLTALGAMLICGSGAGLAVAGVITKTYSADALEITPGPQGVEVSVQGCALRTEAVGVPDLPVQLYRWLVPLDVKITDLNIVKAEFQPVSGAFMVPPVNPPTPMNGLEEPQVVEPDPAIYGSNEPFPSVPVKIVGDGYLFGYHVVTLYIHPVRYYPKSQQLGLLTRVEFELTGTPMSNTAFWPFRQSEVGNVMSQDAVADFVENDSDIAALGPATRVETVQLDPYALDPIEWPSDEGPPVDFVIITDSSLVGAFQPLADWRTRKGWMTVIKTVADINAHYPGRDTAERIRNFIIDAGTSWGTLFFLLGGDVNYVPARFGMWDWYGQSWGPTDLYFATADGDWDANGNGIFGEPDDQVDESIDFQVGRAPVENLTEANVFVDKVLDYELVPAFNFMETALFMGASIGSGSDTWGQTPAEYIIANYLPAYFEYWRLYNILWVGDELLTSATALTHLNMGYHYIYHADHCSPYSMGMGYTHGGGTISRTNVDNLSNGDRKGLLITLGCSPNAFDYDSISERFINDANGGLVAFMGNTRTGWSSQTPQAKALYREVFVNDVTLLGEAFSLARSEMSGYYRRNQNLLGDPGMVLWRENPGTLVAEHPSALLTGPRDFTVRVTTPWMHPLEGAVVCLYKACEVYSVGLTGPDGRVTLAVNCQTGGQLLITATAAEYLPYQASIPAGPPIWGTIRWPNGDPAEHVAMTLISLNCNGTWTTETNASGYYAFEVPADSYEVRAQRRVNCTNYRANRCPVVFNGTTPVQVNLTIQPNGYMMLCPFSCPDEEDNTRAEQNVPPDEIPYSNLYGTVYWNCGTPHEPAPYVKVTAKKVCVAESYTTYTDTLGRYWFWVTPGRYNVTATIRVNGIIYRAQACNVLVSWYRPTLLNLTLTSGGFPYECIDCDEEFEDSPSPHTSLTDKQ